MLTGTVAASQRRAGRRVLLRCSPAISCALAALCYAEFASTVPVAGSAYTFSYATLGELVAWIIGWDLILEFTLGASALATGLLRLLPGRSSTARRSRCPTSLGSAADGIVDLAGGAHRRCW